MVNFLKNLFILAEDNLNFDVLLKENEVLINKPFIPLVGRDNSQIISDHLGFKYRKQYRMVKDGSIMWKCCKLNILGCKCTIKTRGDFIVMQRHQHNHDTDVYENYKEFE